MKLEISVNEFEQIFKDTKGKKKVKREGVLKPAKFELVFDKTKCCSCRLCETVCTQFHEGDANPMTIRSKHVVRPIHRFPELSGFTANAPGRPQPLSNVIFDEYSDHSFCRQCISSECLFICPNQAISLDPKTRARIVDEEKCNGCGICEKKCPWGMIKVNPETQKAIKCDLCGGEPKCAEWCPTDAIIVKEI
jgi:anaerobic carbon-monoxide dehydrogenase iron sulfur subunit